MARRKSLKLGTPRDVRRAIAKIANMTLNNEIEPKVANSLLFACNAVLAAIRIDDQQAKLDELERLVLERNNKT